MRTIARGGGVVAAAVFMAIGVAAAASAPGVAPCGSGWLEDLPRPGDPPVIRVRFDGAADTSGRGARCPALLAGPYLVAVETTGRFAETGGAAALRARIGAVSRLTGIRYWSTTRGIWRDLFTEAQALADPNSRTPRSDFAPSELTRGARLYFRVDERSPMGKMVYTATVLDNGSGRIAVRLVNALPVESIFGPSPDPGDYVSVFDFRHLDDGNWAYLNVVRMAGTAGWLLLPLRMSRASFVNRAAAMFRHFAGIPTDRPPPAAP